MSKDILLQSLSRITSVGAIAVHKTSVETSVCGCIIPRDSEVWVSMWAQHHDDNLWEDPHSFIPERFLDAYGMHKYFSTLTF